MVCAIAATIWGKFTTTAINGSTFDSAPAFGEKSDERNTLLLRMEAMKAQIKGSSVERGNILLKFDDLPDDFGDVRTEEAEEPKVGKKIKTPPEESEDGAQGKKPKVVDGQSAPDRKIRPGWAFGKEIAHTDPQIAAGDRNKFFLCPYWDKAGCNFGDKCKGIHVHRKCYLHKGKSYDEAQHKAEACPFKP
jgi:hypothetical protein